jgi:hypothetical protein
MAGRNRNRTGQMISAADVADQPLVKFADPAAYTRLFARRPPSALRRQNVDGAPSPIFCAAAITRRQA